MRESLGRGAEGGGVGGAIMKYLLWKQIYYFEWRHVADAEMQRTSVECRLQT